MVCRSAAATLPTCCVCCPECSESKINGMSYFMIGGVPRVVGATMPSLFVGQGSDFTCNCLPAIGTSLCASACTDGVSTDSTCTLLANRSAVTQGVRQTHLNPSFDDIVRTIK